MKNKNRVGSGEKVDTTALNEIKKHRKETQDAYFNRVQTSQPKFRKKVYQSRPGSKDFLTARTTQERTKNYFQETRNIEKFNENANNKIEFLVTKTESRKILLNTNNEREKTGFLTSRTDSKRTGLETARTEYKNVFEKETFGMESNKSVIPEFSYARKSKNSHIRVKTAF